MTMKAILLGCVAVAALSSQPAFAQSAPAPAPTTKPLGLTQDAWNARLRQRGESRQNPGYVRYVYNPANIFPVRTRESMITTIKLPEGVELKQAFSGDDQGFQVGIPTPNSIAIKALYPGVDTNLVAYTADGKIFTFYVRSEGYNSKIVSDFLVDVVMPGQGVTDGAAQTTDNPMASMTDQDAKYPAQAAERIRDPYSSLSADRREKYREYAEWSDFHPGTVVEDLGVYVPKTESGSTIPYRVFHDDRFTYIDYGPNATQMTEWPTPLIVVQGVEGPVGFRTAGPGGRMIVTEALGSFVLRNGQRMIIVKPRREVVVSDKTLIEYPVSGMGRMSIPTDLPPGRPGMMVSAPKTVIPTDRPMTANGEAPSQVVALPQTRKIAKEEKRRGRGESYAPAVVEELAVPSPATPVRTVVGATPGADVGMQTRTIRKDPMASVLAPAAPVRITKSTGAAARAVRMPAATMPDANATRFTSPNATPLRATVDSSALSTYKVVIGRATTAQMDDRWKSYRVQYYSDLIGKSMTTEPNGSGTVSMVVTPVMTISEGMRLCKSLASDGSTCTVKPITTPR